MYMRPLVFITAALMATTLLSCHHRETQAESPVKVKTLSAAVARDAGSTAYPGTIEAGTETPLSFPVAGTVSRVYVEVGDKVAKGQAIAQLDATSLQNAYDIALAEEEEANDAYRRMKILHDQKALAEIKWVDVQSKVKQARSATAIARKAMSDSRLTAPHQGVISQKLVNEGQNVVPGVPVVDIMTTGKLKVAISVPENEISRLNIGDKGIVTSSSAAIGAIPAVISEKGVSANPVTRSYTVKLELGQYPDSLLLPGMVCSVSLSTAQDASHEIVLPVKAVLLAADNRNFVWLCKDGTARKRYVTIGGMTDDGIAVTGGIEASDSVIVSGQQKVSEGMKVEPVN